MKHLTLLFLCLQIQLYSQPAKDTVKYKAVFSLIQRILGDIDKIKLLDAFEADTLDAFKIKSQGGIVNIYGNSPIALTRGFYHYLKNACNSQITWAGENLKLPEILPDYESRKIISPYPLRLYYNVCTFGYTTAFWDWPRWEKEIDWMALHGINMPLAMNGQEAIWQKVWNSYGISNKELEEYYTGPAFLPWHRMGNINKYGGPLPQTWIDQNKDLQKKILNRMLELGMKPVVPAFSGFVPEAFFQKHKNQVIRLAPWTGFADEYGTFILHPKSKHFKEIGKKFIEEYKREYGEQHYYLADSFNELKVPVSEENRYTELADFGKAVYESIQAGDDDGIWIMQGWLFYNDADFWDKKSVSALLSKIPDDNMIIIDLANEYFEGWKKHKGFYDKNWIYSIIHNFGGSTKLFGNLEFLSAHPSQTFANPDKGKLIGFGLSPEGIENNEIIYELLTDAAWTETAINLNQWLKSYAMSRYGSISPELVQAWDLLNRYIYKSFSLTNIFMFQRQPSLTIRHSNVDPEELLEASRFFIRADSLINNSLYRNDLIDVLANLMGYKIDKLLRRFLQMHKLGEVVERNKSFHDAKRLAYKLNDLLQQLENKRLSTWINNARKAGSTEDEQNYYEDNAKRQITVWGGPYLSEYAAKLWGGLVKDYYLPRWELLYDSLRTGSVINYPAWQENWLKQKYTAEEYQEVDIIVFAKEILTDIEKINREEEKSIFKISIDSTVTEKNTRKGIRAVYYEGVWEVLPDFSRETFITDTILSNVGILAGKRNNDYGIQFVGALRITKPGKYTFSLESDDGSKLYLNNKELIDNDGLHASEEQVCDVELNKGFYTIRVDFFQREGGKSLKLFYKTQNTVKQEIPGEMLYHILTEVPN